MEAEKFRQQHHPPPPPKKKKKKERQKLHTQFYVPLYVKLALNKKVQCY